MEIFPLQITLLSSSPTLPCVPGILYFWTPGSTTGRNRDLSIQAENQALYPRQEAAGIPVPYDAAASALCNEPPVAAFQVSGAETAWMLLPAPASKWLFCPTITPRKAQRRLLLPGAFGCKPAKYTRVSRTTVFFAGDLNTVEAQGLPRMVKFILIIF